MTDIEYKEIEAMLINYLTDTSYFTEIPVLLDSLLKLNTYYKEYWANL